MDLSEKKIIVLGSEGYLGRHIVHYLMKYGADVLCLDRYDKSKFNHANYQSVDVTKPETLEQVDWNVDCVMNFSGITGTSNSFIDYKLFIEVNELGLVNVLTSIKDSPHNPRVVFPSTRLVYKGSENPLREDAEKEAKTIYASSKIASEHILNAYSNAFGMEYTIYRICVPYGNIFSAEYSYGTIGFMINSAKEKGGIKIFGDGSQRRTFSHVEDLCGQIIGSCFSNECINEIYNIDGDTYSLFEVANLLANKLNVKVETVPWPKLAKSLESGHTVFNADKLLSEFKYTLRYNLKKWIDGLI